MHAATLLMTAFAGAPALTAPAPAPPALVARGEWDRIIIQTFFWGLERSTMWIYSDQGAFQVPLVWNGCQYNIGVPYLTEFCFDKNNNRAHIWYGSVKLCFKWDRSEVEPGDVGSSWGWDYYEETACTWG